MSDYEHRIFLRGDVERWDKNLEIGRNFNCSRREYNQYWSKDGILRDVKASLCTCWVLRHDGQLAAYITLLADNLTVTSSSVVDNASTTAIYPAVKVGVLAADQLHKGAGFCLIDWMIEFVVAEICPRQGTRFITVNAASDPDGSYDVSGFYRQFGFEYVCPDETLPPSQGFRTLYLDLLPFIEALQ